MNISVLINGIERTITSVISDDYGLVIELDNYHTVRLFEDRENAGEAAKQYWVDMLRHSPEEFVECATADQICAWISLALDGKLDVQPYFNSFKVYPSETWGYTELQVEWPQIPKSRREDITNLNGLYYYISQIESGKVGDGDIDAVDELTEWLDEYGEGVLYTIAYSNERL